MRTFTARTIATSPPEEVLHRLTNPATIACWAAVPFEVLELDHQRLYPGANVRVRGQLAGQRAEFSVHGLEVSDDRLTLIAEGPVSLEVGYDVRAAARGSRIHASISVLGHGLIGRLLATATEALLAAGRVPKLSEPSSRSARRGHRRMTQRHPTTTTRRTIRFAHRKR